MIKPEEVYKIGRIGKAHGVKGEVTIQLTDDVFDRVDADYLVLDIDGILVPFFIEEYRFRTDTLLLMKFDGIETQEQARELTGCDVFFPHALSDADSTDISLAQLPSMTLVDAATGKEVGTILSIDDSTMNVLFEVEAADGTELLIPAAEDLIKEVDIEQKRVIMRVPEGLLEI
jgi:16S rRNA processing protein RimM